jgi:hypothetical protein
MVSTQGHACFRERGPLEGRRGAAPDRRARAPGDQRGKKYKRCCLDADQQALRETEEVVAEALPLLREKYARAQEYERRLREEYGVFVNYLSPIEAHGRKVWALGSRLYLDGPGSETFHDFLLRVLRGTFGEAWAKEQSELPEDERHFVFTCNERFAAWQAENADPAVQTLNATTGPSRTAGCST